MVAVVPRPGESIDPAELIEFCQSRMARHMVPRYIDVVDRLPRTPTWKRSKSAASKSVQSQIRRGIERPRREKP